MARLNAQAEVARSWCRRQPKECLALALVLVALGAAFLTLASRTGSLWWGLAGVGVAVAGLTALNDRLRIECDRHPLVWLVLGLLVAGAGGVVIARAFEENAALAAALGVLVAIVGLLPVSSWLRIQGEGGRWWLAPAGLVLIA
ncbi:MAG TPA: hypothetical protein VJ653_00500, partial [Acidimicrobiales bacterium]|nr:hypothetical protein [Acidimicrobiales bacterium]